MRVSLVYRDELAAYDFGPAHPLRPERFTGAVALMRQHGLIGEGAMAVVEPQPAAEEDLLRVHDATYIAAVHEAGRDPRAFVPGHGIGPGDNPAFAGMHEAAALVCGAAVSAFQEVLEDRCDRALSLAGGLHHAHRDRAAGFCIYNDPAVGIAWALERYPDLRIASIDIDAHHADGVQEAFWDEPRVLTASIHESGRYLFPGTGFADERGGPHAQGSALNIPLEPYTGDAEYRNAFDSTIALAVRTFRPNLIVTQNGADALADDPLTSLGLTLSGYRDLVTRLAALSDELTGGRMVAFGGGGYAWREAVPRAWTILAMSLMECAVPNELTAER
ncbi:MAG: acetoin utilization protein AcuC [Actinomycetia bacterium]|nr:acetoin utilization protein AcuC [Actinomycetes bacterium]